jgi:putative endonuclease
VAPKAPRRESSISALNQIMYYTYILFSEKVNKYYVGYTSDLNNRLDEHGKDKSKFTGHSSDWKLIKYFEFETKSEALKLEIQIKKRGIKRFLESLGISK